MFKQKKGSPNRIFFGLCIMTLRDISRECFEIGIRTELNLPKRKNYLQKSPQS